MVKVFIIGNVCEGTFFFWAFVIKYVKSNDEGIMKSRNANETILGYFYQFDKTIIEILKQTDDNNIITVEGIEDIDVEKINEVEIIQCKYHEALEYNN